MDKKTKKRIGRGVEKTFTACQKELEIRHGNGPWELDTKDLEALATKLCGIPRSTFYTQLSQARAAGIVERTVTFDINVDGLNQ